MKKDSVYYMSIAYKEAEKALLKDETPIGCVIVKDGKVIAKGHNTRENKNIIIGHAELETISKANKKLKSWRLNDCDLYVTLEPCIMCAGAIIQSRIRNVFYGAHDPKQGAFSNENNVLNNKNLNHFPNIISGVMEESCSNIIKNYFKLKRKLH